MYFLKKIKNFIFFLSFSKQIYFKPKNKIIDIDSKLPNVLTILLEKKLLKVLLLVHIMSLLFIRNFQTYCSEDSIVNGARGYVQSIQVAKDN